MTHDSPLLNDSNKSRLRNTRRCAGTLHYLLCSHVYNTYARWPPEASYYVYTMKLFCGAFIASYRMSYRRVSSVAGGMRSTE